MANETAVVPPPPGWGSDDLSAFLQAALQKRHATFHTKKPAYALMQRVDACFMRIGTNLINPKDTLAPLMLLRSHAAYRWVRCGMAGQVPETVRPDQIVSGVRRVCTLHERR